MASHDTQYIHIIIIISLTGLAQQQQQQNVYKIRTRSLIIILF